MAHIILNAKKYLYQMICLKSENCNFEDLDFDLFLWSFTNHGRYLTFIDILKGFIPLLLSNFITSHTGSKQLTFSILSNFRDRIYNDCMFYIWIPRCENMIELEKLCNINRREKMKFNRDTRPRGAIRIRSIRISDGPSVKMRITD